MSPRPSVPKLTTPADLLRVALHHDPSAPLVTYYDDATGERVELSAKTLGNWVAKTANLLIDGLGAQPGDRVMLALPAHWQTAVWLFACWSAGLVAVPVEPGGALDGDLLVVTEPDLPNAVDAGAQEIVGLSLHPLGAPLNDCPPGVMDYAVEIRAYADHFAPPVAVDPDTPALDVISATLSGAEVISQVISNVYKAGLPARGRVLTTMAYTTLEGLLAGLLVPIGAGSSVIIQRNLDKAALDRRFYMEHVTAVAGVPGWDAPSGSMYRLL